VLVANEPVILALTVARSVIVLLNNKLIILVIAVSVLAQVYGIAQLGSERKRPCHDLTGDVAIRPLDEDLAASLVASF